MLPASTTTKFNKVEFQLTSMGNTNSSKPGEAGGAKARDRSLPLRSKKKKSENTAVASRTSTKKNSAKGRGRTINAATTSSDVELSEDESTGSDRDASSTASSVNEESGKEPSKGSTQLKAKGKRMVSTWDKDKISSVEEDENHKKRKGKHSTGSSPQEDSSATSDVAEKEPSKAKCARCSKRLALKGCTEDACLQCCSDELCLKHRKSKENALWREQVLAGSTDVQVMAKERRSKMIRRGRFNEPGFVFQGDSIVIWSVHEYMSNPKWRDDAIRKSIRRRGRGNSINATPEGRKRKSLLEIVDELQKKKEA